ncbi:MAG: hypothetical protein WD470_10545 [Rhodospirillaceae bacterium]
MFNLETVRRMESEKMRYGKDRRQFADSERLRFFQFLDGIYRSERNLGGEIVDVIDTQILRTIAIGKLEGRRHDMSSVAAHLGLPRQTVGRRVKRLIEYGAIVSEKCGKRTLLEPSLRTRERSLAYLDVSIEKMIALAEVLIAKCPK